MLAVIANRKQAFSIHTPQEVCTKPHIMSFNFRYVPAVLATTDVKSVISILEIPVPDEIHMEDRNHGLA